MSAKLTARHGQQRWRAASQAHGSRHRLCVASRIGRFRFLLCRHTSTQIETGLSYVAVMCDLRQVQRPVALPVEGTRSWQRSRRLRPRPGDAHCRRQAGLDVLRHEQKIYMSNAAVASANPDGKCQP